MSEETNESSEIISQSTAEFEAKLTKFFSKHKKSKIQLAPRIADAFKGNEKEVLEHLYNKYVLRKETQKPEQKAGAQKPESHSGTGHRIAAPGKSKPTEVHGEGEVKPKSKKKLIVIIVAAIIVIGLGAAAFFMKDKLLGMFKHKEGTEPAKTETAASEAQPPTEKPAEPAPEASNAKRDSVQ